MRASNLNPVLEQLSFKIPLEFDLASISEWLDTLTPDMGCQSCGKILRLLKSLQAQKLEPDIEFQMLGKLRSVLDPVASKLEKPLLDAGNLLPETEQVNAEMIIFSYAELAQRFCGVADNFGKLQAPEMQTPSIASALFQGMEALRRALLYISLLYDQPYDGFWRSCFGIYRRAESLHILETAIKDPAIGNASVDNSFKNLLVFYLSDIRLLTQREMKSLFNLFNHRPVPAKICKELPPDKADLFFWFALDNDAPPMRIRNGGVGQGEVRYVSTIKVARLLCQYLKGKDEKQNGLEVGNYALFFKIAKVLGMQAARKYSRVSEKRNCPALIGVNNVLRYLMKQNSSVLTWARQVLPTQISRGVAGWAIPEFGLVPVGEEDEYLTLATQKKAALSNEKLKKFFDISGDAAKSGVVTHGLIDVDGASLFEPIEILDSSAKDYSILLKAVKTPVKIGGLIGIVNPQDGRVELGLVRRLSRAEKNAFELSVDLISLQTGISCVWRPAKANEAQLVILLPGIAALQQKDSIIFPSHAFSVGETIFLRRGDDNLLCRVDKLLHATSLFNQAELSVVKIRSIKEAIGDAAD